jgi:hypothetical protein
MTRPASTGAAACASSLFSPVSLRSLYLLSSAALFGLGGLLSACSTRPDAAQASPPVEWRLVPQTTVTGDRRQFFVYGNGLDSAKAESHPGVRIEQGWVKPDGKVLSLYLTVAPLGDGRDGAPDDSAALAGKPGLRKIRVRTADTVVVLPLKVLDEAPGR